MSLVFSNMVSEHSCSLSNMLSEPRFTVSDLLFFLHMIHWFSILSLFYCFYSFSVQFRPFSSVAEYWKFFKLDFESIIRILSASSFQSIKNHLQILWHAPQHASQRVARKIHSQQPCHAPALAQGASVNAHASSCAPPLLPRPLVVQPV